MEKSLSTTLFLSSIFLILSLFSVSADYTSYFENYGVSESGNIDSSAGIWKESIQLLTLPQGMPMISDLDGDGTKEIIVIDNGDTVNIFKSIGGILNLVRAYQDPTGFGSVQQIQIIDIDTDGIKEIIFIDHKYIYIVEYNGTDIFLQNKMEFASTGREAVFSCQMPGRCFVAYHTRSSFSNGLSEMFARTFTSSQINNATVIQSSTGGTKYQAMCMPELRTVFWADMFDNGEDYALFTSTLITAGITGHDYIRVHALHLNASNQIDDIQSIAWYRVGSSFYGWDLEIYTGDRYGSCVSEPVGRRFTPVLPYNFVPATDELELGYGVMLDSDEDYILDMKDYIGNSVRRFPQVQNQEGLLISNVFIGNFFADDDGRDLCVFGYNEPNKVIKLLCGRVQTQEEDDTREFYLDLDEYPELDFIVPSGNHNYFRAVHSGDHKNQIIIDDDNPTFNPSELITPYGILAVDPAKWRQNPSLLSKDGELYPTLYFNNEPGVMIASKTKTVSIVDYIFMSNTSLSLIDNGMENTPAWISKVKLNPCTHLSTGEAVAWQQGTDALISVTPEDNDNDQVRARAILYYGETTPVTETLITYNASVNEAECDGVFESSIAIFGSPGGDNLDVSVLLRNLSKTSIVSGLKFYVPSKSGSPQHRNIINDIYLCPSSTNSLSITTDIFSECAETPIKVKSNYPASTEIGSSTGWFNIPFDNPFYLSDNYDNYMLIFKYVSGTANTGDHYRMCADENPTTDLIHFMETLPPSTITSNYVYSRTPRIVLYNDDFTTNEMRSPWSAYGTAGNQITLPFSNINRISALSKLRIEVNDLENPETIDIKTFSYFVETTGVILGECIETFEFIDPNKPGAEVIPCQTSMDCDKGYICKDGACKVMETSDIVDELLPAEMIPPALRMIIGLIIIGMVVYFTISFMASHGVKDGRAILYVSIFVGVLSWIVLVVIGVIEAWTILVGFIFSAGFIGWRLWMNTSNVSG